MSSAHVPPGWPRGVPPPSVAGWQGYAVAWLLDHTPADYRAYDAWRRYPLALAWVATKHIDAQVDAMRSAYRTARVDLGEEVPPEGISDVLLALETEGLRLRASALSARLLTEALQGKEWVPRL